MPNPTTFPISALQFSTTGTLSYKVIIMKHIIVFRFEYVCGFLLDGIPLSLSSTELNEALQYSASPGLPALLIPLRALQQREHQPHYTNWDCIVTVGSQVW